MTGGMVAIMATGGIVIPSARGADWTNRLDLSAGVDLGYGGVLGTYRQENVVATNAENEQVGMHGPEAGIHLGVAYGGSDWSLGIEAGYTRSMARAELDDPGNLLDSGTVSAKTTNSFHVDLKPGIRVDDNTLLYARLGGARTKVEISAEGGASWLAMPRGTLSRYVNGIRMGLGVEQQVGPRLSLDTGLVYTRYGKVDLGPSRSLDMSGAQVRVGLSYHFNNPPEKKKDRTAPTLARQNNGTYLGMLGRYSVAAIDSDYQTGGGTASIEGAGIHGASATVLGGYGTVIDGLYMGGEASFRKWGPNFDGDGGFDTNRISVNLDDTVSASLRLGFYPNPTHLLYARLGISSTDVQVKGRSGNNAWNMDQSKRLYGATFALGYEMPIWDGLVGRFETDYTRYQAFDLSFDDDHLKDIVLSEYGIALGLSYYF